MQALGDLLFGSQNRWGKLAYSIYSEDYTLRELPIPTAHECGCDGSVAAYKRCTSCGVGFLNMSMRADRSAPSNNPGRSYKYYKGPNVLWPFAWGLTNFELHWSGGVAPPAVVLGGTAVDRTAAHTVAVENTGNLTGDEVVFAFFVPPPTVPERTAPLRQLYGFQRIADLAPGETRRISFPVDPSRLSLVDEAGTRRVYPGSYQLQFSNGVAVLAGGVVRVLDEAARVVRELPPGTGAVGAMI